MLFLVTEGSWGREETSRASSESFEALEDVQDVLLKRGTHHDVQATMIRGGQKFELTIKIGEHPSR